ncbi:ROK family Glucokinase [Labilithrix luteola]|uniref:ROK family Glucokinase n=1 Tax=Labilithrix luteola TaxID=1391654 RepID=A0A0K1PYI6_9BACT|nr:ROK family protein [Labilithrix luteola]AKU98595.1 ROK family Glucokinase [Labilithrix luteola]
MENLRIGVDLGGTKVEAVVVRLGGDAPDVLVRKRVPTHAERGYDAIVQATCELVRDVGRECGADDLPIGIGMPGSVTYRRSDGTRSDVPLVKNANTTSLNGRPFHADVQRALGRPIAFANDANCFALAEATWGASRGARVSFGVIMGTGVGGGIVLRGESGVLRAWDGAQGIAGEWGHLSLDAENGLPCYCGRRGCVEMYLAGPRIEQTYAARSGKTKSLSEIAQAAYEGEPAASRLMAERFELFGRAMATVIDILDPDVVVLGGGVSNVEGLYHEGIDAVRHWVFNDELGTRIVKHQIGDSAGVLGAALLPE